MQEQIEYSEIMALGFTEDYQNDKVYFKQYGFEYSIVSLDLTPTLSIDWAKETQLCEVRRIDNVEDQNVLKRVPVKDLDTLKLIVGFFSDVEEFPAYSVMA